MWEPLSLPTKDSSRPSPPPPAVRVSRLSHSYPGPIRALTHIDLELGQGTLTALIGANGCGKSTLLRILAAVQEPTEGEVEILGIPWPARGRQRGSPDFRSRIVWVPQHVALDPDMTGRETLMFLAVLQGVPSRERQARVAHLADSFGLKPLLSRLVRTYSGGERRRLHVAAGMLLDAELLLLDEPTAGLDLEGSLLLWQELLERIRRGRTVVIVTHDLFRVEEYADRVALLHRGRLIAWDTPRALIAREGGLAPTDFQEPALARVYRKLTGEEVRAPQEGKGEPFCSSRRGRKW